MSDGGFAVTTSLTLNARELQRLCAVVDHIARLQDSGSALTGSVLEKLAELVPCDAITYNVRDTRHGAGYPDCGPSAEEFQRFSWQSCWSPAQAAVPNSIDLTAARPAADYWPQRRVSASRFGELRRICAMRCEFIIPLRQQQCVDHRILLWRAHGPPFTEREQLLLSILRPYLADFVVSPAHLQESSQLTLRQSQLLDLVASGMTNRQIARKLQLSEGTVRRHMENIFTRLGVTSRTAAANYAARKLPTAAG